jgi:hypothetical protein
MICVFKDKVPENHTAEGINETIKKSIKESRIIFTDQSTFYVDITGWVGIHVYENQKIRE